MTNSKQIPNLKLQKPKDTSRISHLVSRILNTSVLHPQSSALSPLPFNLSLFPSVLSPLYQLMHIQYQRDRPVT